MKHTPYFDHFYIMDFAKIWNEIESQRLCILVTTNLTCLLFIFRIKQNALSPVSSPFGSQTFEYKIVNKIHP
jgi:hypothetical protein